MSWNDVLLAWLMTCGAKRAKETELAKAFPELRGLDAKLEHLSRQGLLLRQPKRLALTADGQKAALSALGLKVRPRSFTNAYFMKVWLPAKSLGLEPTGLTLDGLRAALVARAAGQAPMSLARARDALLWKELGIASDRKFTLKAVALELLGRRLGRPASSVEHALHLVASSEVGVPGDLQTALRRRYLDSLPDEPRALSLAEEPLAAFSRRVLAAAATCPTRFGADRVFISGLFRQLDDGSLTLRAFQGRLVEASQDGALRLARADLVEAMPLDDVLASETHGPADSTFHFVVAEAR